MIDVSEDVLTTYYELRSRADKRCDNDGSRPASQQDPLRSEIEALNRSIYEDRLGDLRGLVAGEVGIGSGDFIQHALAQKVQALVLIEISRERLMAVGDEFGLRADGSPHRLIVANAMRMDGVDDESLDLLAAKEVIEHLTDYRPFLRECHRVLRPGGRLYLTTPNRQCVDLWPRLALGKIKSPPKRRGDALVREVFGHLYDYLTADEIRTLGEILPAGFKEHIYEFAPRELHDRLSEHGFRTIRSWGTPPQMFCHELRPLARALVPRWNQADALSYALGDNLRIIAERVG